MLNVYLLLLQRFIEPNKQQQKNLIYLNLKYYILIVELHIEEYF